VSEKSDGGGDDGDGPAPKSDDRENSTVPEKNARRDNIRDHIDRKFRPYQPGR